jgi:ergothioneine biosynthesis protein EgtB
MVEPLATSSLALDTQLIRRFREVRSFTESLCEPLLTEDYVIQSMPDVSPPKWHLAHTTWFFENFLLVPYAPGFRPFHPGFGFLFNSYYKSVGPHFERARRGLLSRPSVEEIYRYRAEVDQSVAALLGTASQDLLHAIEPIVTLGLHHEQQHQELLLTDIKHILWTHPLRPAYRPRPAALRTERAPHTTRILSFPEGIASIGLQTTAAGSETFGFDNERPRHRVFLEAFGIHSLPVSCGEFLEFVEAGAYREPTLWLSAGWDENLKQGWQAPLYWEKQDGRWWIYTLAGMKPLDEHEPVCHVSYFEAEAFARWRGLRLPTEAEWEHAAGPEIPAQACFAENGAFHPEVPRSDEPEFFGNVWEWTSSAYSAYPGFRPLPASLGEYNGKFMCGQFVLRGGSCATHASHIRPSYRNFFPPDARWQFSGLRLAN